MICYAVQYNRPRLDRGISGESPYCIATLSGFFIGDNMKIIPLTKGKYATVDDEDYGWLIKYKWYALVEANTCYACTTVGGRKNKKHIRMHRLIMNAPVGMDVDHINRDGTDNRKDNLRICTRRQNIQNSRKRIGTSSQFKGVHWRPEVKKWQARIYAQDKYRSLGHYINERDAALAYNKAANEYFGEFARLNTFDEKAVV